MYEHKMLCKNIIPLFVIAVRIIWCKMSFIVNMKVYLSLHIVIIALLSSPNHLFSHSSQTIISISVTMDTI